jgi:tRNA pseudouridine55 synthase
LSIDGILNVFKPVGPTSFEVVAKVRRWSGEKKVGHAGTLDPQASGTFPVFLGQATKLMPYILETSKTYRAVIELGTATNTYDAEGQVTRLGDASAVTREQVEAALEAFKGVVWQKPPPFSAIKREGKRLYKLARAGVAVETPPRQVEVLHLKVSAYQPPLVTIELECGRGFYLRSVAHDLGEALGCGGHLKELVRLKYGVFTVEETVTLPRLEEAFRQGEWAPFLRPLDSVLAGLRPVELAEVEARLVRHGRPLPLRVTGQAGERARAYAPGGRFLAILRFKGQFWHPERLFLPRG